MQAIIAIIAIYFFILIGFIAKKIFKDDINEKTLILISIYFLQPILTFWGLTRIPFNTNLFITPLIYVIVIFATLILLIISSKYLFDDIKDKSIFINTSLIGNTGNLGIPLGIALFGELSIAYTSIINIANVFFIYTIGIYFFAKSKYTFKQSIHSMLKIPILWFAIFALLYNFLGFTINPQVDNALEMGAYATIVLQLIIFGIYLSKVNLTNIDYKISISVSFVKLLILPIMGIIFSLLFNLESQIAALLIISLSTPLAINNVNNAALFDCKPYLVTSLVFITTILFLILFYFDLQIINSIFT